MRRIIVILMVFFIWYPGSAQSELFDDLTGKYSDRDGFSASLISSDMFDLYLKKKNIEKDSPVFEALKDLDNILVVSQRNFLKVSGDKEEDTDNKKKENITGIIYREVLDYYGNEDFDLFKTEKQMGEEVKVFLKKDRDKIKSLAVVTNSSRSTNLVELQGDIDLKNVSRLSSALDLRGLEHLYKINNSGVRSFYYIDPDDIGIPEDIEEMISDIEIDISESLDFLDEEHRLEIEENAKIAAEKQKEMAEKYREIAKKYKRRPIFLNYPGDTNTVYILDGNEVDADAIREIQSGKIERIEVNKNKKDNGQTTIKIETK